MNRVQTENKLSQRISYVKFISKDIVNTLWKKGSPLALTG